jgi:hypothetical protein
MTLRARSTAVRVPAPPTPLVCHAEIVTAGTPLHRLHDKRFAADAFNPGLGSSRFAPIEAPGGTPIPTLYAAQSFECAAFESLFHGVNPRAEFKTISWSKVDALRYSILTLRRDLKLASLFTPDLMRWRRTRAQIIDTPASAYAGTRAWSLAIHEARARPDGMIWTSRKYDEHWAMMLFGTRVSASDLSIDSTVEVTTDPKALAALRVLAKRADVTIVR